MALIDDDLWTIDDVASRLKISKRKVYRLAQCGSITCLRIGKQLRFSSQWIEEYLVKHINSESANATLPTAREMMHE